MAPTSPNRYVVAGEAIHAFYALFVEYRDRHGYSEDRAHWAAAQEVIEGMTVDVDAINRELAGQPSGVPDLGDPAL